MGKVVPSSVFLVSGGARGITARCVILLAQRYHCKFILVGRSSIAEPEPAWAAGCSDEAELKKRIMTDLKARGEKPTPLGLQKLYNGLIARREIEGTLRAVRGAGGQAEYLSADITDGPALREQVTGAAGRLGPVTGIIHGAGNLADKLIENKTEKDFETVYAAKVTGLENLLGCASLAQLEYLILFSSVAGFFGNVGQADYAIANEILNKTAHLVKSKAPACRVISVDWGPWDAGMVTPELKGYFAERGIKVIPVEVGTQMLFEELEFGEQETVQVVIGSTISVVNEPRETALRTYRIRRKLTLEASPMLGDHVVNSRAVLPMVCAISWIANSCEQLYPGYKFFSYVNYKVLKGIVFDETLADEYVLDLKEIAKELGEITFEALVWSQTAEGKMRYHYSVRLTLLRQRPPAPVYDSFDLTNSADIAGGPLYEKKIVFHGWSFQGVERVLNMNTRRTTMRCKLPPVPESYQGQFPVQAFNYFGVDVGLQSLGIFARLTYEMGSLPLQTRGAEVYRDIPFGETFYVSLDIQSITETNVTSDLAIHDEQGRVYILVFGCDITLSKRLIDLFLLNTLPEAPHR
jgi:NAD(P)-dependent dehydrogenase (short-subunit alcohol dehydrogenase family)